MHEKLEKSVMDMLLHGEHELFKTLKEQFESVESKKITNTDVGFFIDYKVSSHRLDEKKYSNKFHIGDVDGTINGMGKNVGFVLFIEKGYIVTLEAYTYGADEWPEDELISLSYESEGEREYEKIIKECLKTY